MKRAWILLAGFFALLMFINFYPEMKIEPRISGNAIDGVTSEMDGCALINDTLKAKIIELAQDVSIKEGDTISLNKYFVIPGHILKLFSITNQASFAEDSVNISDFFSGQNYSAFAYIEGKANISVDSQNYEVYYSSDSVRVDFPQTDNTLMKFNCSVSCTPSWSAINTSCINESITSWYNDTNSCGKTDSRPTNISYYCDGDGNGIIGTLESITISNIDSLGISVGDGVLNISSNYSNSSSVVRIRENDTTLVEFSHNFSSPLNLKAMTIKKQPTSLDYGYLIVNGISDDKTFYVYRKNNSNQVCIKDSTVSTISSLSSFCDSGNEVLLNCPGADIDYSCNISGNYFVVSGLTHSAVKEISSDLITICTPNWNCTSWTNCSLGQQTRTCTDTKSCGSIVGKPALNQTCNVPIVTCTPSWTCGDWPTDCPESGRQTRTCFDSNRCGATTKTENRSCEYKAKPSIFTFLIGGFILAIIIIIIVLAIVKRKDKITDNANRPYSPQPPRTMGPPQPPAFPGQNMMPPRPINPALQLQPMGPRQN